MSKIPRQPVSNATQLNPAVEIASDGLCEVIVRYQIVSRNQRLCVRLNACAGLPRGRTIATADMLCHIVNVVSNKAVAPAAGQ